MKHVFYFEVVFGAHLFPRLSRKTDRLHITGKIGVATGSFFSFILPFVFL